MLVGSDSSIDMDTHLAEALGISTDELSEARDAAKNAELEQALADGKITEEQVAMMEARQALQNYIEKDEMVAKALGITVEELEAAQEDGIRLPDLMEDLGIEQEDFEANMKAIYEEILQQAIDDDIITQEQADQLLEEGFSGRRGLGKLGHPDFPQAPRKGGSDGTNFQFPGELENQS